MKKLGIIALLGVMAWAPAKVNAQDYDDVYYDASKDTEKVKPAKPAASNTRRVVVYGEPPVYVQSTTVEPVVNGRDVDEYNRRGTTIDEEGIGYDTLYDDQGDFSNTRRLQRFHNSTVVLDANDEELVTLYYNDRPNINVYVVGSRWYDPWYDWYYPYSYSWYSPSWRWGWGWRNVWYDPWYSWNWGWNHYYGWGRPYYHGYYSGWYGHNYWNGGCHYGWNDRGGRRPTGYGRSGSGSTRPSYSGNSYGRRPSSSYSPSRSYGNRPSSGYSGNSGSARRPSATYSGSGSNRIYTPSPSRSYGGSRPSGGYSGGYSGGRSSGGYSGGGGGGYSGGGHSGGGGGGGHRR